SLNNNGTASQNLKQIQQIHGVVVIRDTRKMELRLFGSPEKSRGAESAIREMIIAESSASHAIDLTPEAFQWACRGGFKMLIAALGDGLPSFDVIAKRILIAGSEKDYEAALKLVERRESNLLNAADVVEGDCPVCLTPAENPVRTACGHMYCEECFEMLCAHAGSEVTVFPINCHGDTGTCRQQFALKEIQENLSSKAFEDLLESSFASYIKRHPLMFRYCPKPDCETIYRVTDHMKMNTCTKCFTITCSCCHASDVQHERRTCAEYKDVASGGYRAFETYKKENGVQDCPNCEMPIEKSEGCNHMQCKCGTHICWVCLETFPTSEPCYTHMTEKHGGIGLEHLRRFD
ncbi:MAG: E3 ubiquitin-protein ligase, partial [Janthinobacterium lividum]